MKILKNKIARVKLAVYIFASTKKYINNFVEAILVISAIGLLIIASPILLIAAMLSPAVKPNPPEKTDDLLDTIKNDSIYPKIEKIRRTPKIEPERQKTEHEIMDSLLFEISSDVSCGRSEKAVQTIKKITSDGGTILRLFLNEYFKKQYERNTQMFPITLLALDALRKDYQCQYISSMIHEHTLSYSISQITELLVMADNLQLQKRDDVLLTCYLTGQIDKLNVYLKFNYNPSIVTCKAIEYDFSIIDSDGTFFHNTKKYSPKAEYLNLKLSDVFEFEDIDFKKEA